jgi:alpha-N-acetylglucosamine transferase
MDLPDGVAWFLIVAVVFIVAYVVLWLFNSLLKKGTKKRRKNKFSKIYRPKGLRKAGKSTSLRRPSRK